jgi:hypothetical protein
MDPPDSVVHVPGRRHDRERRDAVDPRVFTTSGQVAGTIGIAAFGTAYLAQLTHPSPGQATHAFATIAAAFAAAALIAAAIAYRSTHTTLQPEEAC